MGKLDVKVQVNDIYIPYLNREERYQVYYGGAGSGKSYFIATKLILKAVQQKQRIMVVRQTFNTHKESTFSLLLECIGKMGLSHLIKVNKTTLGITFNHNGSEFIFRGGDDENKLLSINAIDKVWVEEAFEISQELFHMLETRLRGGELKKQFFLSFNPISELSWLKREFFDKPKDDSFILHTTYEHNAFLDAEYIKTLLDMKERNYDKYRVYALGHWGVLGKPVFENWRVEEFDEHYLLRQGLVPVFGGDFGFKEDPATVVYGLVDLQKRKIYIVDELYEKGLLNNQLADKIKAKQWHRERIIFDSAEQKSIAELKAHGLTRVQPAMKGKGSIKQGIALIQQFEVIIHPDCTNAKTEFENYCWKKDPRSGLYIDTPVDDFNHLIDALRYALEPVATARNGGKRRVMDKKMFGF